MSVISSFLKNIFCRWDHFWFHSAHTGLQISFMRVVIGFSMLTMYIPRQFQLDFYSRGAMVGTDKYRNLFDPYFKPFIDWHFWSDKNNFLIHLIFVGLLILFTFGLLNRFFTILMWVLQMGFLHRNISVAFGADYISAVFIFYLMFTKHSEYFTLKKWIKFNKLNSELGVIGGTGSETDFLQVLGSNINSVFFRLIQIQISVIYVYTGIEKLKGLTWWDGTALWLVLANPQITNFDFTFLRYFPIFFVIISFLTIAFEIYFPAFVLSKRFKHIGLSMGLMFHFGIACMLGLYQFSLVMVSTYFLFIEKEYLENIRFKLKHLFKKV